MSSTQSITPWFKTVLLEKTPTKGNSRYKEYLTLNTESKYLLCLALKNLGGTHSFPFDPFFL
jgi:hypothetical protein